MSEHARSLADLANVLSKQLPELSCVAPLRPVDSGFGSRVVETAGGVIFRIARTREAAEGHSLEWELLPLLAGRVPLAVPAPRWLAPPTDGLPFGAIGYPRLEGRTLSPRDAASSRAASLASELGGFLAALHGLTAADVACAPERSGTSAAELRELRETVSPSLAARLSSDELAAVERWWESICSDRALADYAPALCHGDLWYENVLVDHSGGRLTGILDFERAAIGDPARDLAAQQHLGSEFAERVVRAYAAAGGDVSGSFPRRVERHWELREPEGAAWAVRQGDEAELADALHKLRAGPILRARQPD